MPSLGQGRPYGNVCSLLGISPAFVEPQRLHLQWGSFWDKAQLGATNGHQVIVNSLYDLHVLRSIVLSFQSITLEALIVASMLSITLSLVIPDNETLLTVSLVLAISTLLDR